MSRKLVYTIIIVFLLLLGAVGIMLKNKNVPSGTRVAMPTAPISQNTNPLSIEFMQKQSYPGSNIQIEETLGDGSNYHQYIASYLSEGLKIYALLTVPTGEKPTKGWPVIVFNHGYIPPETYRTTERYVAYVDSFARNGFIVLKPDYRGNGNSEGKPEGAYYSPAYTIDDLNAIASIKKYTDANPDKIGVWGHSMGGNITLRDLVIDPKDIKVAVIWGGVVGSYNDLMNNWHRSTPFVPSEREVAARNTSRQNLIKQYGTPKDNPTFWAALDPTFHLGNIQAPIQLHHGESDEEVPLAFSQSLFDTLKTLGKTVELYAYPGADHNISDPSFSLAMDRSVAFFKKYLQ